jgi:hypothetical protein
MISKLVSLSFILLFLFSAGYSQPNTYGKVTTAASDSNQVWFIYGDGGTTALKRMDANLFISTFISGSDTINVDTLKLGSQYLTSENDSLIFYSKDVRYNLGMFVLDSALDGEISSHSSVVTSLAHVTSTGASHSDVVTNSAKETNVSTALSAGTVNATTYGITSDGGADDIVLPEADTDNAGLLGADKWDEIVASTSHISATGASHSYIDQDVTSGAAPVLDATNFTNMPETSPLTTKGDLYTFDTGNERLAKGTDGYVLKANSATATGLEWGLTPTNVTGGRLPDNVTTDTTATGEMALHVSSITRDYMRGDYLRDLENQLKHIPQKPDTLNNAVLGRYSAAVNPIIFGLGSASYAYWMESGYNQDLMINYDEPTLIEAVGLGYTNYSPRPGVKITKGSLAKIGVIPSDTDTAYVSLKISVLRSALVNQTDLSIQCYICFRYGLDLSYLTNATYDMGFINGGSAPGAGYLGNGDGIMAAVDGGKTTTDSTITFWIEGVKVPANYDSKDFRGILISLIGRTADAGGTVETRLNMFDIAVIEGSSLDIDKRYKNYPDDYIPRARTKKINVINCDKIILFGDSYSSSHYTVRDKAYISLLSTLSDWNWDNYSYPGHDYTDLIGDIRLDGDYHLYRPNIQDYNATYGVLISFTNETMAPGLEAYIDRKKALAKTIESMGMKPIVSSEYHKDASYSYLINSTMLEYARQNDYMYMDVVTKSLVMKGSSYAPFWMSSHPATRTNTLMWSPMLPYINSLPRPRTGLKIFRYRSTFDYSADIDGLLYDTIPQRAERWREISVGHESLIAAQEKYFDSLNSISPSSYDSYNEYIDLAQGNAVSFDSLALVQAILPATARTLDFIKLSVSTSDTLTVYVRNYLDTPYNDGVYEPEGRWQEIAGVGGIYTLWADSLQKLMSYDQIEFMFYDATGFSISDCHIEYAGEETKQPNYQADWRLKTAQGSELLTYPRILQGWTKTGTVAAEVSIDGALPVGVDSVAQVDASNYLTQSFTVSADSFKTREVQINIWARSFPEIFNPADTYPDDSKITSETYDLTTLRVEVQKNSTNYVVYENEVGLHWMENKFNFLIPINESSFDLVIKTSGTDSLQVAKASVKLMD